MHIDITGHQIEVTPALKEFIFDKFEKIVHHGCKPTATHVVLHVEKLRQIAEATVSINKSTVHAHAESDSMYNAIELLVDKLDKQLMKHKEKIIDHRNHP